MKKLRSILPLFLIGILVPMTMTSCLNDDDDSGELSDAEKQTAVMTMSGGYNGNVYFFNSDKEELKGNKNYNDSIEGMSVRFSYPESAFVIYDFPAKLLFSQIENHDDLKDAVAEEVCDIKIKYVPYQMNGTVIYYYMQPESLNMKLTYGGATHDVKVAFMLNTLGVYAKDQQDLQIVEGGIYVDTDSSGNPALLDGKALYTQGMSDEDLRKLIFEFYGKK